MGKIKCKTCKMLYRECLEKATAEVEEGWKRNERVVSVYKFHCPDCGKTGSVRLGDRYTGMTGEERWNQQFLTDMASGKFGKKIQDIILDRIGRNIKKGNFARDGKLKLDK